MKNWLFCLLLLCCWACKDKKPDLSGEVPIEAEDFLAVFPKITRGFTAADTNIQKKGDTTHIGYKALTQFIPDSAIVPITGKDKKMIIRPVGLIETGKENYLLLNFTQRKKTKLAVFVTDKESKYLAGKELLSNAPSDGYSHSISINREPTFIISREKTLKDNVLKFTRAGWVYNDAGMFMVVINDSNEDPEKTAVINPIDTLPRKNKFSGDYVRNDKNYISVRDGKNAGIYLFFMHFEKTGGTCVGELKGELKLKTPKTAQFSESGDPCVIDFSFEGNYITVKEQGSCGSHRGIKCFFDDSFRKKREPKPRLKRRR